MTETIAILQGVRDRHHALTRGITFGLSAAVCAVGFTFWGLEVPLLDEYKALTGLVLMVLSAVFYKIPHIAFLINRRHYAQDKAALHLMGETWSLYKARMLP